MSDSQWWTFSVGGNKLLVPKKNWWHYSISQFDVEYQLFCDDGWFFRRVALRFRGNGASSLGEYLEQTFRN